MNFSRKPVTVLAKWNYRGLQKGGPVAAVNGFQYGAPRTTLDLNVDYEIRRNLSIYLNAQNVFNVPERLLRYGPETPGYARPYHVTAYGVQLSLGLRGTF